MKKVFDCMAILSFLFLMGTVGAIEQDLMGLDAGAICMGVSLSLMWLTAWLAGWFEPYMPKTKKSRPGSWHFQRRQMKKPHRHYRRSLRRNQDEKGKKLHCL